MKVVFLDGPRAGLVEELESGRSRRIEVPMLSSRHFGQDPADVDVYTYRIVPLTAYFGVGVQEGADYSWRIAEVLMMLAPVLAAARGMR